MAQQFQDEILVQEDQGFYDGMDQEMQRPNIVDREELRIRIRHHDQQFRQSMSSLQNQINEVITEDVNESIRSISDKANISQPQIINQKVDQEIQVEIIKVSRNTRRTNQRADSE